MEREKQADKETAKQKEIIEFKAESAKAEDSEQEKSSQVITLMYCNYVLKRLWEDDLQLDQKIKELKKTRKELRFDLNSAAEYMCFCKAILPDSEEYGLIDRDSFLGNPVGNMYYDDFEQTFNEHPVMRRVGKGSENSGDIYLQLKHQWQSLILNAGLRYDYKPRTDRR